MASMEEMQIMKLFIGTLAVILILAACKETSDVSPCNEITPGVTFNANIHDTWCLSNENLKITFNAILEDSRCNVLGVFCVWAGRSVIEFQIDPADGTPYKDTLTTDENWQGTLLVPGHSLTLLHISPEIRPDFNVDTSAYLFNMLLQ